MSFDGWQICLWLRPPGKVPDADSCVSPGQPKPSFICPASQARRKVRGKALSTGLSRSSRISVTPSGPQRKTVSNKQALLKMSAKFSFTPTLPHCWMIFGLAPRAPSSKLAATPGPAQSRWKPSDGPWKGRSDRHRKEAWFEIPSVTMALKFGIKGNLAKV